MINVYKIKIGEKVYEVEVESVTKKEGEIITNSPKPTENKTVVNTPVSKGGVEVESPMQGAVIEVSVKVGDKVSKGDTILMLEAMKMENAIIAPVDGTISEILVNKGDTVDGGEILATISE